MSLQTDQRTGLDELEGLDFDYDPPCEHSQHGDGKWGHSGSAWALLERLDPCGCHGGTRLLYLCKGAWDFVAVRPIVCRLCGAEVPREQFWRFVALVRP